MPIRGIRRPSVIPITAPSFPTPPQPHVYRKIAYTFVAFTVVIVLGVLWLSSVSATVLVKVRHDSVKLDGTVEVAKAPTSGQITGRVVQGVLSKVQEFAVADSGTAPMIATTEATTSTSSTPTTPVVPLVTPEGQTLVAKGNVTIINKYAKAQTLVKTTRLLTTDGKLYRIDKTVTAPSNGSVVVGVYADQPGSEFAIGPTTFTIPGLWIDLQKLIYAQSDTAFVAVPSTAPAPKPIVTTKPKTTTPTTPTPAPTGKVVTQAALDAAFSSLSDVVLDQEKKMLAAEVTDPNLTEVVFFVKTVEKQSSVTAGQSADKFLASVKLEVTAVYYPKEDMLSLIRAKLLEKIPAGREFLPLADSSVVYTIDSSDSKNETAVIHVVADGSYRLTADSPLLQKSVIAGKSKSEAETLLKAVDGVESATVTIHPSWMSKIPSLKDRIELKVE